MTAPSHAWQAMRHSWHVAFVLAMTIAALLTASGQGTRPRRLGGVACVAALSLLYATIGRRMIGDEEDGWWRWAYLAPTIALHDGPLHREATVKTHLLRAFAKLGVDDRTAAVTVAIERGFLPSPGR